MKDVTALSDQVRQFSAFLISAIFAFFAVKSTFYSYSYYDCCTVVVISKCGGFSRCFFTAHCSAERMTASRYFSGKPAGREAEVCVVRDVHSHHFLIHTDLSLHEADDFVED